MSNLKRRDYLFRAVSGLNVNADTVKVVQIILK